MNQHNEDALQKAVVKYLHFQYPLVLFTASAGGMFSSPSQGAKMKAMGYRRGTPDLFIEEARQGFHGLRIELKTEDGRVSPDQAEYGRKLYERGYKFSVCYTFFDAVRVIDEYLRLCEDVKK